MIAAFIIQHTLEIPIFVAPDAILWFQKSIAMSYQVKASTLESLLLASSVRVYIEKTPKLRNPIMVCGLPDSGNVAKLVIDQLVKQLKAAKFAEIYSNSLPPRVLIRQDGTVELMKHSMFFWANTNGGSDILMYTGDAQPANPEAAYA